MMKILTKEQKSFLYLIKKIEKAKTVDKVKFVDLGRDMFKGNKHILNKYFKNEKGQDCYFANLLAYKSVKDIMSLKELKAQLKADFGYEISLAGYKYVPEHYMFSTCLQQLEYEETAFKENEDEQDPKYENLGLEMLDFGAVEALYKVLLKAIKNRYVMIFNLESIPGLVNNALECQYLGVNCTASNLAMNAKLAEIRKLLEDKDIKAWLETGASDMNFDKEDYISTYQRVLRQLTGIRDTSLEYCKDILHNEYDLFEDEILANELIEGTEVYDDRLIGFDIDKQEYFISEAYEEEDFE